ncbi:hypothetical protein [Flavisolibacter tropicus]|uniref:Uncharacterized protein n=1 Tax=Flavisolibacter tropicus TaxID=1492898 RepID=A0A172U1C0_9BACT|nr:hypothetical protein [Flavisolibacter tropicus]ANE53149.1 hypothetical protein SY85_24420 [Flavisolibacter tropicus]
MKLQPEDEEVLELVYPMIVQLEEQDASQAKALLQSGFLQEVLNNQGYEDFLLELLKICRNLIFTDDEESFKLLDDLRFPKDKLNCFVSMKDLKTQINNIKTAGIKIHYFNLFGYIRLYLEIRAANGVLLTGTENLSHQNKKVSDFTKKLISLKRRREDANADEPKTFLYTYEGVLNQQLNTVIKKASSQIKGFNMKTIVDLSKGNSDKLLLPELLEQSFDYDSTKMSRTTFLDSVYDLFALLTPLPGMDEYLNSKNESDSYKTYRAKTLWRFIYKK